MPHSCQVPQHGSAVSRPNHTSEFPSTSCDYIVWNGVPTSQGDPTTSNTLVLAVTPIDRRQLPTRGLLCTRPTLCYVVTQGSPIRARKNKKDKKDKKEKKEKDDKTDKPEDSVPGVAAKGKGKGKGKDVGASRPISEKRKADLLAI